MGDSVASDPTLRRRKTDTLNGWLTRNVVWIVTVIFLSGGLVASWGLHIQYANQQFKVLNEQQKVAIEVRSNLARQIAVLNQNVMTLEGSIDDLRQELREHRRAAERTNR